MKKDDLKPIGSEIEQIFVPSRNDQFFTLITYRVSAHTKCAASLAKDASTYWAEEIVPLRSRKFVPCTYVFWCGNLTAVPPVEALHLLDEGWKALFDRYPDQAAKEQFQ